MRTAALLLIPWILFSPLFGVAVYVFGLTADALVCSALFIVICLTVNVRTILRTSESTPQSHPEPWKSSHPTLGANLNRPYRH